MKHYKYLTIYSSTTKASLLREIKEEPEEEYALLRSCEKAKVQVCLKVYRAATVFLHTSLQIFLSFKFRFPVIEFWILLQKLFKNKLNFQFCSEHIFQQVKIPR